MQKEHHHLHHSRVKHHQLLVDRMPLCWCCRVFCIIGCWLLVELYLFLAGRSSDIWSSFNESRKKYWPVIFVCFGGEMSKSVPFTSMVNSLEVNKRDIHSLLFQLSSNVCLYELILIFFLTFHPCIFFLPDSSIHTPPRVVPFLVYILNFPVYQY